MEKYEALTDNDAHLFAITKCRVLLASLEGEHGHSDALDVAWTRQTAEEIVALVDKAARLAGKE